MKLLFHLRQATANKHVYRQILSGKTLVIQEPYACLMHQMDDLEQLRESEKDPINMKHLEVLLQFLRPLFNRRYVAARNRSESEQPTVRFDDVWVLMKPYSLAYTKWDGEWLGCLIGECTKVFPDSSDDFDEPYWVVEFLILQIYWNSDEFRIAKGTVDIDRYDGEQLVTHLPIHPVEFHDAQDMGVRRREFAERGRNTCRLIWEGPRYAYHDGKSLNKDQKHVSLPPTFRANQ